MHALRTFRSIFIATAILLACLPPSGVQAAGPYIIQSPVDEITLIDAGELCDFPVLSHARGSLQVKYWFDQQGKLVRELDNYRVHWTYTANGITLRANTGGPSHVTFVSDTEVVVRYTGAYTLVAAPGRGVVLGSAGQGFEYYHLVGNEFVMYDSTFKSGLNAFWDPAEFCAALSPR